MTKPTNSKSASDKTRGRIIRAAECLFAEKGFRAMTLRDVTQEAHVNLAAVNYHFGSKINLMRAVIERRFEPINAERLERLNAAIAEHRAQALPLETIFEAMFRPLFNHVKTAGGTDSTLIQMIGRALTEPASFMRECTKNFSSSSAAASCSSFKRSCPELSEDDLQLRFFLSISTMLGTITEQVRLENMTSGKLGGTDLDSICDALIGFVVAGFRQTPAPSP